MIQSEILGLIGYWLTFAIIAAFVGVEKKIGYWGAFVICLLTGPIIGIIICLLTKNKEAAYQ